MASVTYSGTFGAATAGSDGKSVAVTGTPIPSNATITDVTYTLDVSAGGYSSSNNWILHWFAIGSTSGTPIVSNQRAAMSDNKYTFRGSMYFVTSDVSKFTSGEFTLYAKANTDHNSTSYMGAFTITVEYETPTACGAPSNVKLSATTSTGSNATLSWSAGKAGTINAITGYEVQRAESSDGSTWGSWAALTTTTSTSLSVAPPTAAGSYYKYRVRTRGAAGSSYYSGWAESSNTLRRMWTACGAPSNVKLSATTSTGSNATLSWAAGSAGHGNAITGYEVQRAESSDGSTWGSWAALTTTTSTSLSVAPPTTAGSYYKYRVRTRGAAGSSYYSGWAESSNTLRRMWTACGAPSNVKLSAATSYGSNATLSWAAGSAGHGNAITDYEVQRAESSDGSTWGSWVALKTTTSTSLSVAPPATYNHYYKYRIRTRGAAGASYYSGWVQSGTLKRNPPDKCTEPSNVKLSATTSTGSNVTLSWAAGKGGNDNAISYYQVARKLSTDGSTWGSLETVKTTTALSLSVAPPAAFDAYYRFYVRTVGAAGTGYASSWATCSSTLQKVRPKLTAYTDSTITAGKTPVKAVHMTELQSNINALRQGLGLAAYSFTTIKAGYTSLGAWNTHIREMRTAIDGITTNHEAWLTLRENRPRADVLMQLRRVVASI